MAQRGVNNMTNKMFLPALIILLAIMAGAFALSGSGSVLRPILVFGFMLICPGLALVRMFDLNDSLSEFILGIALSISINILLAEFMAFTHLWSPNGELGILILISFIGAGMQMKKVRAQRLRMGE